MIDVFGVLLQFTVELDPIVLFSVFWLSAYNYDNSYIIVS